MNTEQLEAQRTLLQAQYNDILDEVDASEEARNRAVQIERQLAEVLEKLTAQRAA